MAVFVTSNVTPDSSAIPVISLLFIYFFYKSHLSLKEIAVFASHLLYARNITTSLSKSQTFVSLKLP